MNSKFRLITFESALAIAALVAAWLVLSRPWFFDGQSVPWDSKDVFYPVLHFIAQSFRHGEFPGWNPYVYGGYPIISDPQAMIFSPLAVILMSAIPNPSIHWFDGIELVHVLLAGIGMLLVSLRLGRSVIAALFAAVIYMYGGPASGRMEHVPMILAYAYFPFALLALDHAMQSKRWISAAAFGVLAGTMAAHQNQVAYLFSLVLLGYAFYKAASSGSFRQYIAVRWRIFTVAAAAGIATLAIPLYLTLQFLPWSNRVQIPYSAAASWSIHPLTLMSLFIRNFFGNARFETYWGFSDVAETYLFAGTLPVVLLVRYGMANGLLLDRQIRYFLCIGGAAVLYAVGRFTPFYWIAYHVLPGVDLYRRPSDATFVVNMALAVVSGFLLDAIISGKSGKVRPAVLIVAGIPLLGFFAWAFAYAYQQNKLHFLRRELAFAILFVAVSLWLLRAIRNASSSRTRWRLSAAVVFLLAADMGVHSVGSALNAVSYGFPILMNDAAEKDPVAHFLHEELSHEGSKNYRAEITGAGTLWGNAPMFLGIQSTQGYNPLRYRLYDQVAGAQDNVGVLRPFTPLMPSYDSPLFGMLGVKYVVSDRNLSDIDPGVRTDQFDLAFKQNAVQIWKNSNLFPRVSAVTSIFIEPDIEQAIHTGKMAAVDYRSTAVLAHVPKTLDRTASLPAGRDNASATILEYTNNRVTIGVQTDVDAIVVLNDPYYPYWRVYVDGAERELLQANYLFRGVHVKPGERQIVFRFEPFSWSAIRGTIKNFHR